MSKKGYKQTKEHKRKLSEAHRGLKHTEEAKRKIREWNIGRVMSKESRLNSSLAKKGKYSGKNNPKWKGGRNMNFGYVLIHRLNHPNRDVRGYVREHRLVMEEHLGRCLTKEEVVHHIDKDRANNNINNLTLFKNNSEHMKFERRNETAHKRRE